jgi:hypothetical protein
MNTPSERVQSMFLDMPPSFMQDDFCCVVCGKTRCVLADNFLSVLARRRRLFYCLGFSFGIFRSFSIPEIRTRFVEAAS